MAEAGHEAGGEKRPKLDATAAGPPAAAAAVPQVDFSKTKEVGTTRWLRLETISYADQTGTPRVWVRPTAACCLPGLSAAEP